MHPDDELLQRIVSDSAVLCGKPVIRGTRLSVAYILNLLGHGATVQDILDEYESLSPEDIRACVLFASNSLADTTFMPLALAESL